LFGPHFKLDAEFGNIHDKQKTDRCVGTWHNSTAVLDQIQNVGATALLIDFCVNLLLHQSAAALHTVFAH